MWQSIKNGLQKVIDAIEKALNKLSPDSELGKRGQQMVKTNKEILDRFVAGVKAASDRAVYTEKSGESRTAYDSRGNGYSGYSMSNNAVDAYENGEKPLSKWSKADILDAFGEIDDSKVALLSGVSLPVLRKHLLYNSSWHHTSKMYNKTKFYAIDEDAVNDLSKETISKWIAEDNKSVKSYKADFDYTVKENGKTVTKTLESVNVAEQNGYYVVTDDDGNQLVKRKIGDRGTFISKASYLLREARKNTRPDIDREDVVFSDDESVRYDLRKDVNGNTFVDVDPSIYDETDGESVAQVIAKIISDRFHNLIETNGQQIRINAITNAEWRRSEEATYLKENDPVKYSDKLKAIGNADEILKTANKWIGEAKKHDNKHFVEFARGNILYRVGENGYAADVIVGTKADGSAVLYDLVNIHNIKITEDSLSRVENTRPSSEETSVKNSIPQNAEKDNTSDENNSTGMEQSRDADYLSAVNRGDLFTSDDDLLFSTYDDIADVVVRNYVKHSVPAGIWAISLVHRSLTGRIPRPVKRICSPLILSGLSVTAPQILIIRTRLCPTGIPITENSVMLMPVSRMYRRIDNR